MSESAIFKAAVKLAPEQRSAYLDEACGLNQGVRQDVESLLRAHDASASFLADSPDGAQRTVDQQPIAERPGTVIGPYELMEQIGEGGFGLVFVAEQQEPVRRKVALKIIKPGMDSREVIARFEAERQALALMDHPNIARIFDGGTTDSGRPYFVMELVKGIPIIEYCDQQQLTAKLRLDLFLVVCQAVQHAHGKGIIHRDLKPSNILVAPHDGVPVVKVIDFGVAKAIGQQLTSKKIYTRFAQMIGTPLYMSPEQAEINALDVDIRSDVYSLGVLLYELLTGSTPFDRERFATAAYDEIRRIIKEEEPPRPSTRLSTLGATLSKVSEQRKMEPGKLSALVRGDLDWIVMKALEKDRTRRYDTASAMAADVRRFMSEEPIEARPPSAGYRFRKFARRNKAAMTTMTLVAATLLLGIVGTGLGLIRAVDAEATAVTALHEEARQRKLAVANEEKAKDEERKAKLARDAEQERTREVGIALKNTEQAERREKERAGQLATALTTAEQAQKAEKERTGQLTVALKKAAQAQLEAEKNETKAEWRLYASNIGSAQRAWESNNGSLLFHFLDQCRPGFRGWEHDYLYTLANQNQQTLRGHEGPVISVAFSPDGKRLASASRGGGPEQPGELKMWDAVTGRLLLTFKGQTRFIPSVAFSPDGNRLASASLDGSLKNGYVTLWDAASGKEIWTQPAGARSVAFSPDGNQLAAGGRGLTVWDAASGKALLTLAGHKDPITSVAFSPDGKRLASASWDKTVKLWELASGKEYLTLKGHTQIVQSVAFSPDGKHLASGSFDLTVKLWDAASGQEILTLKGHGNIVDSVAFSPDGKRLASASADMTMKLWNTASGQEIQTLMGHVGQVNSVAFSPDGKRLASASEDKTVKLWEFENRQDALTINAHPMPISSVAFSPDGKRLASASGDSKVKLWDAASGKELLTFNGHTKKVSSVAFSPDGKRLASASWDTTVKVWDAATGKELLTLNHTRNVESVSFSPDGKRLASAAYDNNVRLWDAASGKELLTINVANSDTSATFSPDGRLAGADWKTVRLWDPASGKELLTLLGHTSKVNQVAFSPDGKRMASASRDKTLKLWDAASGEELLTLKGHTDFAESVAFSPDGKRLASASLDMTLRLWDAVSGQELLTLRYPNTRRYENAGRSVVFSPDGKRLAGASSDGTIIFWDASKSMKELEQK